MIKCLRCKYEWKPRTPRKPVACPDCKHRRWFEYKNPETREKLNDLTLKRETLRQKMEDQEIDGATYINEVAILNEEQKLLNSQ